MQADLEIQCVLTFFSSEYTKVKGSTPLLIWYIAEVMNTTPKWFVNMKAGLSDNNLFQFWKKGFWLIEYNEWIPQYIHDLRPHALTNTFVYIYTMIMHEDRGF